jgi:hypothetical protein
LSKKRGASNFDAPLFASKWLPVLDEFRNFLVSGEGTIMAEQIKQFNIDFGVLDGVPSVSPASKGRAE